MLKTVIKFSSLISIVFALFNVQAFELKPEQVNGIYTLATPERSAAGQTQKLQIEFGDMNGQKILATLACQRCPATGFKMLDDVTKDLGRPVFFNSAGIYIIAYDANTFVSVMADGQFGKKIWSKIAYANIYSKQGTPSISLDVGKQFALAESKRLMTGEGVAEYKVAGGSGTYYAAVRQTVGSQQYDQIKVELEAKKKIHLEGMNCSSCTSSTYLYEPELSNAIGKPVYEMGHMGRFLIEQDKGIIWVASAQLGKAHWENHNNYNVLAQDKSSIRKLSIDKSKQKEIEGALKAYAVKAKAAVDARYAEQDLQRTAANKLPAKGMQDKALESSAFTAAQAWANSYAWKETLKYVYLTSPDWGILRHTLTGVQTGRRIHGAIVMQRPDGLCSYQGAVFEQAYNGTDYQKTVMSGVVPGQNKLDCSKI